jgi:hypothetical protein
VDRDFKKRYWRTLLRHILLDLIFSFLVFAVVILIWFTLLVMQPLFASLAMDAALPVLLTALALIISVMSFTLKWISIPLSDREGYHHDLCKKNCEHISSTNGIPSDMILCVLVGMKDSNPDSDLQEAYELAPELFSKGELVRRFYGKS